MKKNKNEQAIGFKRFMLYIEKLDGLLQKAGKQKNPALWLYRNNARTSLFMLEGLAKMYSEFHNKKYFVKLKEKLKLLEDTLGAIDYYDSFAKEFKSNKKIPLAITGYLEAQAREKIQNLNEILIEDKWLSELNVRIEKIKNKLAGADWLNEKDDIKAIDNFYGRAIYEITEFVNDQKFVFDNIEKDVHELRRKLRWLSIYPQALQGCIQLSRSKKAPEISRKYLTKDIINSPFNILPEAGDSACFLLFNRNSFLALSWLIAELGRLKDSGLTIIALKEAIQQTSACSDSQAFRSAYQYSGKEQLSIESLLNKSSAVCKIFFDEHILESMIIGIRKTEQQN